MPVWIDALGTVTPAATVTVRPQVSGTMKSVRFEEGQMVKAGELLAEIDARPFELSLMQAQGQQQRDQAQLDNARLTLKRYELLWKQDSIARQDVDTQAALVKQLEGTAISNRGNEGTARLNLGYTRVVAPIAGRVGLRNVDVGNVVAAGDANGIAVITRLAPIDVEFALPQDRVPELQRRVATGAALPVTVLDRNRTSELDRGSFSTLNNQADTQTGTVRAKARFPNAQGALFPSQFVNVRLLLDTLAGAVVVPTAALRHGAADDFVFVLQDDQTVLQRKVTAGQAVGDTVVISSGLEADERVITEGADRLKDGVRVVLPGERAASGAAGMPGRGASGAHRDRARSLAAKRRAVPPDRARRVPGGRGSARRGARARSAGAVAPAGLAGGRPDRAAGDEPLQRRPRQLYRGGLGAGLRAKRAAHAGPVRREPAERGGGADPRPRRGLERVDLSGPMAGCRRRVGTIAPPHHGTPPRSTARFFRNPQ